MADVKIRKLPDWLVETHRSRAQAAGRSLEEEFRCLLTEAALRQQHQFADEVTRFRENLRKKHGLLSDSTKGIVEERNRRG